MDSLEHNSAKADSVPNVVVRERRHCLRHKVRTPAHTLLNGSPNSATLDLQGILDISEEGMCIESCPSLESGRNLDLCLDLAETKTQVRATGRVAWSSSLGRVGVEFLAMPFHSKHQLKQWLFLNALKTGASPLAAEAAEAESKTESCDLAVAKSVLMEQESQLSAPPDFTSTLSVLTVAQREVEMLGTDLDAALQVVAKRACALTGATGAAIALHEDEAMICLATSGVNVPSLGVRVRTDSGFSGECIRTGQLLCCDDAEADSRVNRESCLALGIRSIVAAPIRQGDAVIGLLEIFSPQPAAFNVDKNVIVQYLADTVTQAVDRSVCARTVGADVAAVTPTEIVFAEESSPTSEFEYPAAKPRRAFVVGTGVLLLIAFFWLASPWMRGRSGGPQPSKVSSSQGLSENPKESTPSLSSGNSLDGLRHLAEQGDAAAQFALGARYAIGEGVTQDYAEAARWFSLAAEQGNVMAQGTLGTYYWAGRGVPQDFTKAYFWAILAQVRGNQDSKYWVSMAASRMSRAQILTAQQQANDWLKQHQMVPENPSDAK